MKLLWEAIQNVTVELLGVVAVVWMLCGLASWGLHSAAGRPPAWNDQLAGSLVTWQSRAAAVMPEPPRPEVRAPFVAERLDHYSQLWGAASQRFIQKSFGPARRGRPDGTAIGPAADAALLGAL